MAGRSIWLLLPLALAAPFATGSSYWQGVMAAIAIWSIAAVSLAQAVNWMVRLSLMTPALMGVGAYAAAILQVEHGWSFPAAALAAALASMAAAGLVGLVAFHSSAWGFSIVTFAANLIFLNLAISLDDLTHGPGGYSGIPPVEIMGRSFVDSRSLYYLALAVLLVQLGLIAAWRHGVAGRSGRIVGRSAARAVAPAFLLCARGGGVHRAGGGFVGLAGACTAPIAAW